MDQVWMMREYINSLPTGVLVGVVIGLFTLYYWPIWDRHRYPPGPFPWPFVGNIPLMLKYSDVFFKYIYENRDKFGDVFTLRLNKPTVFLNSAEAIHEGFVKNADALSNRPQEDVIVLKSLGVMNGGGVGASADGIWQVHRRHLLTVFKEQGVGKMEMENVILKEIQYFHEALESHNGQPVDVKDQLIQSVSNIATHIAFGRRFEYNSEQLANLQIEEFFAAQFKTSSAPILRYLPFDPAGYQRAKKDIMKTMSFIRDQIAEHKNTIDYDSPRDFIDSFLIQQRKLEGEEGNPYTDDHLISVLLQIYVAGTDTTSSVLYWTFLYMVLRPDIQEKIYLEIKETIGERSPLHTDRVNMPYTMSAITELLRIDIAQRSIPHYAKEDVVVHGHTIPKGTTVIANLWSSTHNEQVFGESTKFNPDRFMDGGSYTKPESKLFIPFGIGRRSCPGESLARMELFLFITCTLQKYKVMLGQDKTPSTEGRVHFTFSPLERYKIKFVERL